MKKNKGMKIYKQRKRKKGSNSQIISILGTCAVVFGVGIFGYYVLAVPVYDFVQTMSHKPDLSTSSDTEVYSDPEIQITSTPESDESKTTIDSLKITEPAVTTVTESVVTSFSVTKVPEVTTEEVTTVTEAPLPADSDAKGGCVYLSVSDISSVSTLVDKLNSIDGYSAVVIPLKTTGGRVNYASSVSGASLSGAVSSDVSIDDIVRVINEKGMTPIAQISTIADNIYPETYKKSAYQFDDGVTGEWLDNKADAGGKPWLSPFSDETISYLSDIVDEVTCAGIKNIICTDLYFPPFRDKDLGYIGDIVNPETRYKGLTNLVNTLDQTAASNGGKVMLSVSAADIINSSAEVFKPEELGDMTAVVTIDLNNFSGESVSSIISSVRNKSGNMGIVPCLVSESASDDDLNLFKISGYDLYIIK